MLTAVSPPSSPLISSPVLLTTPSQFTLPSPLRKGQAFHWLAQSMAHQGEIGPRSTPYIKAEYGNTALGTGSRMPAKTRNIS